MASIPASLLVKRGDDFSIDMTVTNTNNTTAIAAKVVLDAALAADPQVPNDISAAQMAYDAAIVVDITNWVIFSQMRWHDELIQTFTVVIIDAAAGIYRVSAPISDTVLWVPRTYDCDLEFSRPGALKTSSETFTIKVEKDISYV